MGVPAQRVNVQSSALAVFHTHSIFAPGKLSALESCVVYHVRFSPLVASSCARRQGPSVTAPCLWHSFPSEHMIPRI